MPDAPRRQRGRPPLDPSDPSVDIGLTLPGKQDDALYKAARTARCSVPEVIRRVLRRRLPPDTPDPLAPK